MILGRRRDGSRSSKMAARSSRQQCLSQLKSKMWRRFLLARRQKRKSACLLKGLQNHDELALYPVFTHIYFAGDRIVVSCIIMLLKVPSGDAFSRLCLFFVRQERSYMRENERA